MNTDTSINYTPEQYQKGAEYLRNKIGNFQPKILLILGSGLGGLGEQIKQPVRINYQDVPYMKQSTAPDHQGRFLFGTLGGMPTMVMQGRLHFYEGWTFQDTACPIRMAKLLGIDTLFLTNAAGAVNRDFQPGDIMLIQDHINLSGQSPLRGENLELFGPRFPDMSHVYTPELQEVARKAAKVCQITLREGVYMYFPGPQYETPAEVRLARILGADAVGMSTVPEAIAAAHCHMRVLGLTLCTNMAAGVSDQPLSSDEVLAAAQKAGVSFSRLVLQSLNALAGVSPDCSGAGSA